ncbi:hypothetical protein C5167_008189 [Papaver somniferum]|uniref:Uncharacterized protein n=1 Tax=Papaver somniferum TaxID=3469 RepID=A0A4Y7JWY8_PAPSO|nr:hypothetical protein C5167_008189 [Papaver somniferum]
MNREPPNKSLGFFDIYKEAYEITISWKKLFSQITLALILPLTILYLSDIHISDFIISKAYPNIVQAKWIVYSITSFVYLILILLLFFFSTSVVACCVSCFYTSKDTTFKKVVPSFNGPEGEGRYKVLAFMICLSVPFFFGLLYITSVWNIAMVWGRLLVTFLLLFFILAICTTVYLGLILLFVASFHGRKVLAFIICLTIPYFIVFAYMTTVWNIAMVMSVLEKDNGRKALVKSMRLIKGRIWVSSFIFIAVEIIFTGMSIGFYSMVLGRKKLNLVGKIFVGIIWYLLSAYFLHLYLVIQAVVYFVCKSYHDEDILNLSVHLEVSHDANFVRGNEEV